MSHQIYVRLTTKYIYIHTYIYIYIIEGRCNVRLS